MIADGYEPRFDRDYDYGRQGELGFDRLLDRLCQGQARAEIKRKSVRDVTFYIETEQNAHRRGEWKPSGVYTSQAEAWVFVIADSEVEIIVPRTRILRALELGLGTPSTCSEGDNPTRGVLLNLGHLISQRCDP